jgi:hypothetical protein
MIFHTIFPLVLPLIQQPSARLEAEDTLPPFFIIGIGFGPPVIGAGPIPLGLAIGIGAGFGPPVVTPGLVPAIGIGADLGPPVIGAAGIGVGLTPGANLISSSLWSCHGLRSHRHEQIRLLCNSKPVKTC